MNNVLDANIWIQPHDSTAINSMFWDGTDLEVAYTSNEVYTYEDVTHQDIIKIVGYATEAVSWGAGFNRWKNERSAERARFYRHEQRRIREFLSSTDINMVQRELENYR